MNTPVNFKIAKLLKEKGFDEPVYPYYISTGELIELCEDEPRRVKNSEMQVGVSAPTIAEVVMWLYEKHGIWIACETSRLGKFNYRLSKKESSKLITLPFTFEVVNAGYDFNSPTEAYEAAIEYTLKNLIQ